MKNEKSEAQRSLESILRDSDSSTASTLAQLLPEPSFTNKSEQIKRNISDFIQQCLAQNNIIIEMIDRCVRSVQFSNQFEKKLALFSVEMLSGDYGDSYKLFIRQEETKSLLRESRKNQPQIEQQIQAQPPNTAESFTKKYSNFIYFVSYIRKNSSEIPQTNMNYFTKILSNIITNQSEEVYAYFLKDYTTKTEKTQKNEKMQAISQQTSSIAKPDICYLIEHSYYFGGISEMIAKMLAEEGEANKYVQLKKIIVDLYLEKLRSQEIIKANPDNYHYLLEFVSYLLSRTRYRSDDTNQQITKICQRFVDQNILWFFKEKVVKSIIDSNGLLSNNFMNSSGTLGRSQSSKSARRDYQLKPQNQKQFRDMEASFSNSVQYLKIIAERINNEDQNQSFQNQSGKPIQPTLDFQVDEAIFGQNSLYELFTVQIPYAYKSLNKMSYYELLLRLTRNSRFQKSNSQNQIGLLPSFLIPILIHLLKIFRRQSKRNGLVNLYIEQLISEAILPRIQKFDNKQAMMILSALNPSEQILLNFPDTRTFTQKLLLIMSKKCQWFGEHFQKLGIDINTLRERFTTKLGNNEYAYQNRKYNVKELLFLADQMKNVQQKQLFIRFRPNQKQEKGDRIQDDDDSSEEQKDIQEWNPVRKFEFPEGFGDEKKESPSKQKQKDNENSDLEQNLFKNSQSEIVQQIHISFSDVENQENTKKKVERKQSQIELMVDSAEQEDEVLRDDMKPQSKPEQPPS